MIHSIVLSSQAGGSDDEITKVGLCPPALRRSAATAWVVWCTAPVERKTKRQEFASVELNDKGGAVGGGRHQQFSTSKGPQRRVSQPCLVSWNIDRKRGRGAGPAELGVLRVVRAVQGKYRKRAHSQRK